MFLHLLKSLEDLPTQESGECYQQVSANTSKIPSMAQMNYCVLEPLIFQSETQSGEGVDGAFGCGEGHKHSRVRAHHQDKVTERTVRGAPQQTAPQNQTGSFAWHERTAELTRKHVGPSTHTSLGHKPLCRSHPPPSAPECQKALQGRLRSSQRSDRTSVSGRLLQNTGLVHLPWVCKGRGFSSLSSRPPIVLFMEVAISSL